MLGVYKEKLKIFFFNFLKLFIEVSLTHYSIFISGVQHNDSTILDYEMLTMRSVITTHHCTKLWQYY